MFSLQTKIANLTKGTLYEVKVQGATRSMKESSKLYRGDFSEPRKVILQSKCISKFYPFSFLLTVSNCTHSHSGHFLFPLQPITHIHSFYW